jgi:hypothetical protein
MPTLEELEFQTALMFSIAAYRRNDSSAALTNKRF